MSGFWRDVHLDDLGFLNLTGISDDHLHEESVDLCLRQRVSTFLLNGVLCGEHEERIIEGEGLLTDGHLPFLHGLEQRTLHLCRCAVDLVGEDEVGKDGAFFDLETLLLHAVNHGSYDIGRQQVGGKLDAAESCVNQSCQRFDGEGLGQSRDTLKQHVSVGEQCN